MIRTAELLNFLAVACIAGAFVASNLALLIGAMFCSFAAFMFGIAAERGEK